MSADHDTAGAPGLTKLAGRYLTFVLGDEAYAIPVLSVREIIRAIEITPVPRMSDYIKGVINLRGKVLPVMDLRIRFKLSRAESTERTCTIVVQTGHGGGLSNQVGLVVDAVEEVVQINAELIEPAPDFGSHLNTEYILAMARIKGGVKALLDIEKIIAAGSIAKIEAVAA